MLDIELAGSLPDPLIRRMVEHAPSAMVVTRGPECRIVHANRAFARLTGQVVESLKSVALPEVLPGLDLASIQEACRTKDPVSRSAVPLLLTAGDDTTWWDLCSVCLDDTGPDGAVVMTSAHEVTDHVAARRDAQAAQAVLDAVMAHIPEGITVARGPGVQVERVSAHGKALTRKTDAELLGVDAVTHPEAWEIYAPGTEVPIPPEQRPLAKAISDGEIVENRTLLLRRPDGSMIPVLCSCGPIRDEAGRVTGGVLAWRDISELHEAQAAAHGSAERLALALKAGGFGTWETDLANGLTRCDVRLVEMLGLPPEATLADTRWLTDLVHPDDREQVVETYMSAARLGSSFAAEFRVKTVLGEDRWVATQGIVMGGRAVGVVRDVTARKLREERLQHALADRDLIVREADHRIKNSLQLIGSLLALQQSRLTDPEARAALGDAITRVRTVSETHKFLHQSSDLKTVDVGQMLSDICKDIGNLAPAVTLRCELHGDLPLDAERAIPLGLLISETVTNASKHAYPGGVAGTIVADAKLDDGNLLVRIVDEGVGMPTTPEARGSGLGGTIVLGLARQIGASVDVASSKDRGTTITIRLPLKPEPARSPSRQ